MQLEGSLFAVSPAPHPTDHLSWNALAASEVFLHSENLQKECWAIAFPSLYASFLHEGSLDYIFNGGTYQKRYSSHTVEAAPLTTVDQDDELDQSSAIRKLESA